VSQVRDANRMNRKQNEQESHQHGPKQDFTDPVCGMSSDREDEFIRFDHQGRSYYFCSDHCLQKFKNNPEEFAGATTGLSRETKEGQPAAGGQYTCPMHPEVIRDDPGSCPKCGMALEPMTPAAPASRTEYTCPMHPEVVRDSPGTCPKCGMALEPRTVSMDEEEKNPEYDFMRRRFVMAPFSPCRWCSSPCG
jgi:P-type Cu+ transporter